MSAPSDWGQFYHQQNLSAAMFGGDGRVSESTVVTTSVTSAAVAIPTSLGGSGNSSTSSSAGGHLSPEGRVTKPVRRRSRASRRTPTTLLNTDTTNFRAMVQQFTGGPTAPFASGSHLNSQSFGFPLNPRQGHVNPSAVMVQAAANYHPQYQQQNQPPYMFSLGNNTSSAATAPPDLFFQGLVIPRPTGMNDSDGFMMEGLSSPVVASPDRPPPARQPSSSTNENRSNTFLF